MAEPVMTAPPFDMVLSSEGIAETKCVAVSFRGVDEKRYRFQFTAPCVAPTMAALAIGHAQLLSRLPIQGDQDLQPLLVAGAATAMKGDGTPILILVLEGRGELPLEIPQSALAKLSAQIDELLTLADPKKRN